MCHVKIQMLLLAMLSSLAALAGGWQLAALDDMGALVIDMVRHI